MVLDLRGGTVVETMATLTVVRERVSCVLIYSNIENAPLSSLPWTQVANVASWGDAWCNG